MRLGFSRFWPVVFTITFSLLVWFLALLTGVGSAGLANKTDPLWASPAEVAIRKVSGITGSQNQPNTFSNMDCQTLTYRTPTDSSMRTGCFTPTAFGLLDTDSDMAIFNGTDEAVPILSRSNGEVLVPWPHSLATLGIDSTVTGGAYIRFYKNSMNLETNRDYLARVISKRLASLPDLTLKNTFGQPLIINPQTLAFSSNGSWMVTETLNGNFIRINLATLDQTIFAPAMGATGIPATLKSEVAVSDNGRYVSIENSQDKSFKIYDLAHCTGGLCSSHDYEGFVGSKITGINSFRHIRFINEGLLSFEVISKNSTGSGTYLLAPSPSIESLTDYIGLGDSYTSGEGAFDYRSGTDTDNNHCHLSVNSYPELIAKDIFTSSGGHAVACSGAVINDVGSSSSKYVGQVDDGHPLEELIKNQSALLASITTNYMPGYIAQHNFIKEYLPRVVSVSVGGNDIGFGSMVQACVMPHISASGNANTCFNTYEDKVEVQNVINRTGKKWESLFKKMKSDSPMTQIYVIGYPEVVARGGNCALNVHLNEEEIEFTMQVTGYLNSVIAKSAQNSGVRYVDISKALAGHRLCETKSHNVAVNGLTSGKDGGLLGFNFLGKESYHPNLFGHKLIEQEILRQTKNLSSYSGVMALETPNITDKPKSDRPITTLVPTKLSKGDVLMRNQKVSVNLDGANLGLASNTKYTAHLDREGVVIGSSVSDVDGSLNINVSIPTSSTSGAHSIQITGEGHDGTVTLNQPVYVAASSTDIDGDGQVNNSDSCPLAQNSNFDADKDNIDDACDPFIDTPPSTPTPPTPSSSQPEDSGDSTPTNIAMEQVSSPVESFRKLNTVLLSTKPINSTGVLKPKPTSVKVQPAKQPVHQVLSTKTVLDETTKKASPINWLFWMFMTLWLWWLLAALAIFIKDKKEESKYTYYTAPRLVSF